MKTGIIRFNVTDRDRKFRGQDRNFDTVALANLVNGGEVQERVSKRDLTGFFGHMPRRLFGVEPEEGGVVNGKYVHVERALVTTSLKAFPDGTIEHEAEFLDTAPGRLAKRAFSNKTGGFSSAIAVREVGGRDVPIGFHGFDFVMEPNFSKNRGYALDAVGAGEALMLDDAVRESMGTIAVLDGLYNSLQADYERQAEVLARVMMENEALVAMIAKGAADPKQAKAALARLDSAGFRLGDVAHRLDSASLMRTARQFEAMELPGFEAPKSPEAEGTVRKLGAIVRDFFPGMR